MSTANNYSPGTASGRLCAPDPAGPVAGLSGARRALDGPAAGGKT